MDLFVSHSTESVRVISSTDLFSSTEVLSRMEPSVVEPADTGLVHSSESEAA